MNVTRWVGLPVTAGIAGIAGWASYLHTTRFVTLAGQGGALGHAYAGTIDGILVMASLALLKLTDTKDRVLAYLTAVAGVSLTLWANIDDGVHHGLKGIVVAGWPALAFALAFEILLRIVKAEVTSRVSVTADALIAVTDTDILIAVTDSAPVTVTPAGRPLLTLVPQLAAAAMPLSVAPGTGPRRKRRTGAQALAEELAAREGISVRQAYRYLAKQRALAAAA